MATSSFATNDPYLKRVEAGGVAALGSYLAVSNLASGGAIATQANIDNYSVFAVNQTTASQTITVLGPTDTTAGSKIIYILNTGSQAFTVLSISVTAGRGLLLVWNGSTYTTVGV